jgi:hypothetical protein
VSADEAIFIGVLALRLGVPLLIPRFPLPAILAALVIDAADQTIFQQWTNLNLDSYQGYDKALDVYYLTIAYLSTIRNWQDPFAIGTARFLWYYRLTGVLLFELSGVRALLIIFPNTFEYFFIAYEAVRLWWDPRRLSKKQVIGMAAFIWIFIKLPQEWWIHIAQLDFTDFMKEDVFGVTSETPWGEALSQNLWFIALMVVLVIGLVFLVRYLKQKLPPPDWSLRFDANKSPYYEDQVELPVQRPSIISWYMFEKIALVTMVSTIFALILPGSEVSVIRVAVPVAFVIVVSSFVSYWIARRGHSWSTTVREFGAMAIINIGVVVVAIAVVGRSDSSINRGAALFFVFLLTLIVTLYDRYHRAVHTTIPFS